jgi:hypothetical protein
MPPIRPTGPVPGWWSPNHVPSKLSVEPPVTSAQPLWRLVKGSHTAEARVRPIEGIGLELRYEWNDELRVSQMFRSWDELKAAPADKRRELDARGWHARNGTT